MKILHSTSIALALALGAATASVVIAPAAIAAKSKAPSIKMSDSVRNALIAAQTAQKSNDLATAQTKINEAKAAIQTDDDRYMVGQQQYDLGKATNNPKLQEEGVGNMLQSGKVPAENQGQYYTAYGQLAFSNNDYANAENALQQAIQGNPADTELYGYLAETKFKLNKPAEAVGLIQQAADKGDAAGKPISKDWYERGMAIGMQAKLAAPSAKLSMSWLKNYSNHSNWRDALEIYRQLHPADPELDLDIMRLKRAAGALKGERDYAEYAEATYLKFPGEAKGVVDEGVAAGAINVAQSRSLKELSGIASGKVAADKASLKKSASNGRTALGIADAYASYGDYASAIEMYDKAASLGGVDASTVNLRKGAALAKSGQKDAAKQVLAQVTGPRADLAQFWIVFIDHPPAG
jgi:tetratricopeptide (TPR) repeat protein